MSTSRRIQRRSRVPFGATLAVGIGLWTLWTGAVVLTPLLLHGMLTSPPVAAVWLLELWSPGCLWTMVIARWGDAFVRGERQGPRFWGGASLILLVPALTHAALYVSIHSGFVHKTPFSWFNDVMLVLLMLLVYGLTVAVAFVVTQRDLAQTRERELRDTQLRALRARLQPHFLFNTLHAIATTCRRDADAATGMLTLLGDLLRQTLRERDGRFVALAEERDLLQPYLELQRLRFPDRLRFELDLPAEVLRAAVPDLLLQPLVENAVLHGIEQRPEGGTVRIAARRWDDRLEIRIEDDGAGLREEAAAAGPEGDGDGIGLRTTRDRLRTLFGHRASVQLAAREGGGTVATLLLPFREAADAA